MIPIPSLGPGYWEDQFEDLSDNELIKRLRSTAFACANINSNAIASNPRKLFVKRTGSNEEVLTHPLLDLLDRPNKYMDGNRFLYITQMYLETVGRAYWRVINNNFGLPAELWILQPQLVSTETNSAGLITKFRYSNGSSSLVLNPSDVVDMYGIDLSNPYQNGKSPMQLAMEHVHHNYLVREHQNNLLENKAEPGAIISPKPDSPISESALQRFIGIFRKKHRRNSGGLAAINTPVDITPLSFNSKDSEFLAFYTAMKLDIANVFGVPQALLESMKSRAELEASLLHHGRLTVNPKCKALDAIITNRLCALFNTNLFVQSDNAAPEDMVAKASIETQLVSNGIISADECRERLGIAGSAPKVKKEENTNEKV